MKHLPKPSMKNLSSTLAMLLMLAAFASCKRVPPNPYFVDVWPLSPLADSFFSLPYSNARYVYRINGKEEFDTAFISFTNASWPRFVINDVRDTLIEAMSVDQRYSFTKFLDIHLRLAANNQHKERYYVQAFAGQGTISFSLDGPNFELQGADPRYKIERLDTLRLRDTTLYGCAGFTDVLDGYRYLVVAPHVGLVKLGTAGRDTLELKTILLP